MCEMGSSSSDLFNISWNHKVDVMKDEWAVRMWSAYYDDLLDNKSWLIVKKRLYQAIV